MIIKSMIPDSAPNTMVSVEAIEAIADIVSPLSAIKTVNAANTKNTKVLMDQITGKRLFFAIK